MQTIDQKDGGPGSRHLIFWTSVINVRELGSIMANNVNERGRDNGSDGTINPQKRVHPRMKRPCLSLFILLFVHCVSWTFLGLRLSSVNGWEGSLRFSGQRREFGAGDQKPEEVRKNRKVKGTQTGTFHMIGSEPGTLYCDKQQSIKAEWSWRLFCRVSAPVSASVWVSGQRRQFLCCIKIANGTKL